MSWYRDYIIGRISGKIVLFFASIGLFVVGALALVVYLYSSSTIRDRVEKQLEAIRQIKHQQLSSYLTNQVNAAEHLARSPTTIRAFKAYQSAYQEGTGSETYATADQLFNAFFQRARTKFPFQDFYLATPKGEVVYSLQRQSDFGTNLVSGRFNTTALATAFNIGKKRTGLTDFRSYAPNNGKPVAFMGTPLLNSSDQIIGVLIVKFSPEKLSRITTEAAGFGASGQSYLVGADFKMRTNSRFTNYSTILNKEVRNQAVVEGLKGLKGTLLTEDYMGEQVLAAYQPFNFKDLDYVLVSQVQRQELSGPVRQLALIIVLIASGALVLMIGITVLLDKRVVSPIRHIRDKILCLARGEGVDPLPETGRSDEVGQMRRAINQLIEAFKRNAAFATNIREGQLDAEFEALSQEDILGNALLSMRDSLRQSRRQEEIRNWSNDGHNTFNELMRRAENLSDLCEKVIGQLVHHVSATHGGLYMVVEEEGETHLEMKGAYAFGRQKRIGARFELNEGLVGQCYAEQKMIYLREVPQEYIKIESGLGEQNPSYLLLVPLVSNEQIVGVWELAAFQDFPDYEREFINELAEDVAAEILVMQINERTRQLLEDSQQKTEQMQAQEEEMRQNMEEMQATQEEMERNQRENQAVISAINSSFAYIEFDPQGYVLNANDNFLKTMGYSQEEIEGQHHQIFVSEEWAQSADYEQFWENLRSGQVESGQAERYTKSGQKVYLNASYSAVRDNQGNATKVIKLATDITQQVLDRLRAQRETQARIRGMNQIIGLLEFDTEGHILEVNDLFLEWMGYRKDELVGKHHSILVPEAERQTEDYQRYWQSVLSGQNKGGYFDRLKKDGNTVRLQISYTPVQDENDQLSKVDAFVVNISHIPMNL